jgi:hypothetical protein
MKRNKCHDSTFCTRRDFVGTAVATTTASLLSITRPRNATAQSRSNDRSGLEFIAHEKEYRFDTGVMQGTLRSAGASRGLTVVVDSATGTSIAKGLGLFSHYRLLDAANRYGHAAWDWPSESRLLPGGSVEVLWSADQQHPFDMRAVYRWAAANALDVTTSVVPRRDLRRFEVFLASYFEGFPASLVRVAGCPETGGTPGFLEAKKEHAVWQMFPRDDEAAKIIGDGRWQRPPNPVSWKIMPWLEMPLAMRRDATTGLTGLVMAPKEDCFAVSTPYGEEGHRSLYFSLLGRDIGAGQTATARSRLILGRGISDEQAVTLYEQYMAEIERGDDSKGRTNRE